MSLIPFGSLLGFLGIKCQWPSQFLPLLKMAQDLAPIALVPPILFKTAKYFWCLLISVFLSFCLSVFLSFCLSVFLYFYLSIFLSFCLSVFLSFSLSFCLLVFLSFCLSVFLSFCLSVSLSTSFQFSLWRRTFPRSNNATPPNPVPWKLSHQSRMRTTLRNTSNK